MALTLDTNRILFPTQRRFNAAWQEMSGAKLRLLPQVAREVTHHRLDLEFLDDEAHRAREALTRVRNHATKRELLLRKSDIWWAGELLRKDGLYELVDMSLEQRERADAICEAIDPRAFPRTRPEEVPAHSDTIIIAQALATGQTMLVTGNMRSIDHAEVNEWAARHADAYGIEHPDVLHVQDELMPVMYAGPERRIELCAIGLGAAWPDDIDATWDDMDRALQGLVRAMVGARLEDTGTAIAHAWREATDPEALLASVRSRLPEKMRESERRHPALAKTSVTSRRT